MVVGEGMSTVHTSAPSLTGDDDRLARGRPTVTTGLIHGFRRETRDPGKKKRNFIGEDGP